MALDGMINQTHRVVRLEVSGGVSRVRDSLSWRLATGIPHCSFVASDSNGGYELLIAGLGDDAFEVVQERLDRMVDRLNEFHPSEVPLRIAVTVDAPPAQRRASA
jgi:hypothetical protein